MALSKNLTKLVRETSESIGKVGNKKFSQEVAETLNKKMNVEKGLASVRKSMIKTSEASLPVKDVIEKNVQLPKRKANGRRDIKSAKESAAIFNSHGREMDSQLAEQIGFIRESRMNQKLDVKSSDSLLKNMKNSKNETKWNSVRERINEKRQMEKELESVFGGSKEAQSAFSNDSLMNEYQKRNRVSEDILLEKEKQQKLKQELLNKREAKQKNPSAKNKDTKGNANNFVYRAAAAGVGGGLVLSMANNRGQQSNAQLYGQGGY